MLRLFLTLFLIFSSQLLFAQANLIGSYPFNGNAHDTSVNGNDGQVIGAVLTNDRFGDANSAYHFDGINDYIDMGTPNLGADNFTICAWFNPLSLNAERNIFHYSNKSEKIEIVLRVTNGNLVITDGNTIVLTSNQTVMPNKWTSACITVNDVPGSLNDIFKIYINGVLDTQAVNDFTPSALANFYGIGSHLGSYWYFHGAIDDVQIYDQVLADAQIAAIANNQTNQPVPWVITSTIDNHTIIVNPSSLIQVSNNFNFSVGDYIGAFFNDNGTLRPAGAGMWDGSALTFPVFGNDATPPLENGFNVGEIFTWKVWQASTGEEIEVLVNYLPYGTFGIVTDSNKFAQDGISAFESVAIKLPAPWVITSTGENHTIIIDPSSLVTVNNNFSFSTDDYIGAFFNDNGTLRPAGAAKWTGSTISFPIYGNDASPPLKNGFDDDEVFQWRVWETSTGDEIDVMVSYLPVGSFGIVTDSSRFVKDGVSAFKSVAVCLTQDIIINGGWNMISAYIQPLLPNLRDIFSQIEDDILIVKNSGGQSFIPSLGINSIGDWNIEEGYKVKASSNTQLTMGCEQVDPINTSINLPSGWSIVAYLHDSPMEAPSALSSIISNLLLAKDNQGNAYLPAFNLNNIGDMVPGQGYKVKLNGASTLTYSANKGTIAGNYHKPADPEYFVVNLRTGSNATIVVPVESVQSLEKGDEIGIFNQAGMLAGAAVYEGRHLAVTVWGDDPTTEVNDGLSLDDPFVYRVWRVYEQKEYAAEETYESGDEVYRTDGISVLKTLNVNQPGQPALKIYPIPADDVLTVEYSLPDDDNIQLSVVDIYGKRLLTARIL